MIRARWWIYGEQLDNAIKGDSLLLRREGDDASVNLFCERGSNCLGLPMKRDVYKEIETSICTEILRYLKSTYHSDF